MYWFTGKVTYFPPPFDLNLPTLLSKSTCAFIFFVSNAIAEISVFSDFKRKSDVSASIIICLKVIFLESNSAPEKSILPLPDIPVGVSTLVPFNSA